MAANAALVVFAQRCDETCDDGGPDALAHHWWATDGSWQWSAQLVIALVALGAATGVVTEILRGHYRRAAALLAAVVISATAWIAFVAPLGERFGI